MAIVRYLACYLLFFLSAISAAHAAQEPPPETTIAYDVPPSGKPAWQIYDDDKGTVLFFDALIGNRRATGIADTGMTFTSIDRRFATNFRQASTSAVSFPVSVSGGAATTSPGPTLDLEIPYYKVKGLQATVVDLSALTPASGRPIDFVLGINVIGSGSLELDLANHRWRLGPTGVTWPEAAKAPLRYTANNYHNYVVIDIEGRSLRLAIDTGYDGGLMLTAGAATQSGLMKNEHLTSIAAQGIGGISVMRMLAPAKLHFGTVTLAETSVEIDDGGGIPTQWGLDGMIGIGIFCRLHAALDYPAGTMFYVADQRPPVPLVRSTVGLQMLPVGNGLSVIHVMANSPAALAGWKVGERICAVDEVKVDNDPKRQKPNNWNVAAPGTRVSFRLCDGSLRSLTARRFY